MLDEVVMGGMALETNIVLVLESIKEQQERIRIDSLARTNSSSEQSQAFSSAWVVTTIGSSMYAT
jgi:hypothetical protein